MTELKPAKSFKHRPPYILDQGWRLLLETDNPEKYLSPERFRAGREGGFAQRPRELNDSAAEDSETPPTPEQWYDRWLDIRDHTDIAFDRLTDRNSNRIDLQYLVLTTDAGIGKTKATEWIYYRLNCSDSPFVAFRFELSKLIEGSGYDPTNFSKQLIHFLAGQWRNETGEQIELDEAKAYLNQARLRGTLCLILDGLDQLAGEAKLVNSIMSSPAWNRVRIVIAGRPNSLKARWENLFKDRSWRYIHVESFDEAQQDHFLHSVINDIPDHVLTRIRPIMNTPRVLEYLLTLDDFSTIQSASDVYYLAIGNMLKEGILRSEAARRSIAPVPQNDNGKVDISQIRTAFGLLSAIAFESLIYRHLNPTFGLESPASRPEDPIFERFDYSDHINPGEEYGTFVSEKLRPRWSELGLPGELDAILRGLGALNCVLEGGLFDTELEGLDQVRFTNRSLHEFLVAFFLARYATPADCQRLWDWIYIKDNSQTDAYYFVWQYLCEMPVKARNPEQWLSAIAILFQPCQCDSSIEETETQKTGSPTRYFAKRSTEMMFRCWESFEVYLADGSNPRVRNLARKIRTDWIREFEKVILKGDQGSARERAATAVKGHLMPIEGGQFRMGTLPEKQGAAGISSERRDSWQRSFNDWRSDIAELDKWVATIQFSLGRAGVENRTRFRDRLAAFVEQNDFEGLINDRYPADETPLNDAARTIESFELGSTTITNDWFRLFDPGHYLRQSELWQGSEDSPTPEHPVVYVSWFDAFLFSKWLHWNGESCRLPWEDEWEFVAKMGLDIETQWHWRYWWSDEFDTEQHSELIHCWETGVPNKRQTVIPVASMRSQPSQPLAMLGNVWEWCQDSYRGRYERSLSDVVGDPQRSRVLRGGRYQC